MQQKTFYSEILVFWVQHCAVPWVITNVAGYHVIQVTVSSVVHRIFTQKTDRNKITIITVPVTCTPPKTFFILLRLYCSPSDDIQSFLSVAVQWLVLLLLFRKVFATNVFIYVSLTMHLSITLANNQIYAQIFNIFITILYICMFRAIS